MSWWDSASQWEALKLFVIYNVQIFIILMKIYYFRAEGEGDKPTKRPLMLSSGVNTVTRLIEKKKASLVVIAHDVEPIEVIFLYICFLFLNSNDVFITRHLSEHKIQLKCSILVKFSHWLIS